VFPALSHSHTSLARLEPTRVELMKLTQVGSGLAGVEVTGRGNTGLLRQGNNYGRKKFYSTGPHWPVL